MAIDKRYDQPFYVGISNTRFKGVSIDGYLPALEEPETSEIINEAPVPNRLKEAFQQIKAEVTGWRKKHAELQLKVDQLNAKRKTKIVKPYKGVDIEA